MNLPQLFVSILNWLFGLIGMLALILGLSFMPTLFGYENPDQVFMVFGGVTLFKGMLGFFGNAFAIGVLIVSTALFVWVGLLFSMSFHTMIESISGYFQTDGDGAHIMAWVAVLIANFILVALFVYTLFGTILTPTTLLLGVLMISAMCALLFANYREVYHV